MTQFDGGRPTPLERAVEAMLAETCPNAWPLYADHVKKEVIEQRVSIIKRELEKAVPAKTHSHIAISGDVPCIEYNQCRKAIGLN